MSAGKDYYKHLNKTGKFTVEVDMVDVVKQVESMNYGVHRFISELINIRKASKWYLEDPQYFDHTNRLEQLLEDGFF